MKEYPPITLEEYKLMTQEEVDYEIDAGIRAFSDEVHAYNAQRFAVVKLDLHLAQKRKALTDHPDPMWLYINNRN